MTQRRDFSGHRFGGAALGAVLLLGGCPFATTGDQTDTIVYVERACAAYESALATLVPHKPELSDDAVRAVDAMNTQADEWCLPGQPVPENAFEAIARLAEMSARLGTFLAEVK